MSIAEVQRRIKEMTVEERLDIAAFIMDLNRMDDPEFQEEMDHRMTEMDKGHKYSEQDLRNIHEDLIKKGR